MRAARDLVVSARRFVRALALSSTGHSVALSASIDGQSRVSRGSRIAAGTVLSHSVIDGGATVESGSAVEHSTVGECSVIGRDAIVISSSIGSNVAVGADAHLLSSQLADQLVVNRGASLSGCSIGSYSYVGPESLASVTNIGRFCSIGQELLCGHGEHPSRMLTTSPVFYSTQRQAGITFAAKDQYEELAQVAIGNDVWIGARAFIRNGVTIGDGAIIGAGAVVVRDVEPYAVVGGVPARVLRMRFDDPTIERLVGLRWWDWDESRLMAAAGVLAQEDPARLFEWVDSSG